MSVSMSCHVVGELQKDFQDVAFLSSRDRFCSYFLINCGRRLVLWTAAHLKTVVLGNQCHALCKIFLICQILFSCQLNFLGPYDCHNIEVIQATSTSGDITLFRTMLSVCLSCSVALLIMLHCCVSIQFVFLDLPHVCLSVSLYFISTHCLLIALSDCLQVFRSHQ